LGFDFYKFSQYKIIQVDRLMMRIVIIIFTLALLTSGFIVVNKADFDEVPVGLPDTGSEGAFVVLELFTSLSCSSCPDADKLIGQVQEMATKKKLPIFPIAFHVDYWNHLEWVDKFSDQIYSERQQQYSRVFNKKNLYTPQMIVNGQFEFVGSKKSICEKQIYSFLNKKPDQPIEMQATFKHVGDSITVFYSLDKITAGLINIAVLENSAQVEIKDGENKGLDLNCYNTVRHFTQVNSQEKSGKVIIKCPEDLEQDNLSILVYLQNKIDMRIKGATKATMI
jgi:hypothetical protein